MTFKQFIKSVIFLGILLIGACAQEGQAIPTNFNQYWFAQGAEINRFELEQARYGEIRKGEMTMIFVTEPFNLNEHVKSDVPTGKDVRPILKLIFPRNFHTGVYPYTTMTSVFTPIDSLDSSSADSPFLPLKISFSAQEWCGMVYHQLNQQKKKWLSRHYSYFQKEGDQSLSLEKVVAEDGLLNLIRLNHKALPVGNFRAIPSLFFIRLQHSEVKSYEARGVAKAGEYKITYPELDRELVIHYEANFPHRIISWQETYFDGWGDKRRKLTTHAKNVMTRLLPYWGKNTVVDEKIRKEMGYSLFK